MRNTMPTEPGPLPAALLASALTGGGAERAGLPIGPACCRALGRRKTMFGGLAGLVLALATGCHMTALPSQLTRGAGGIPAIGAIVAPGNQLAAQTQQGSPAESSSPAAISGKGVIDITIRWPANPKTAYRAQLIPDSTEQVVFNVRTQDQSAKVVATTTITRPAGSQVATASMTIAAGTYGLDVHAYRTASSGSKTEIANANAVSVQVVAGARGKIPALTMADLFVPAIATMSTNVGQAGDLLVLTGSNLSYVNSLGVTVIPKVYFHGDSGSNLPATAVLSVKADGTSLQCVVPSHAVTGPVSVVSDGATSVTSATSASSLAVFFVPQSLAIDAPRASWDSTGSDTRSVLLGSTLQFTATPTFVYYGSESASTYSWAKADPPGWILDPMINATIGTISQTGLLTATTVNSRGVYAKYGTVTSNTITANVVDVQSVSLSPSSSAVGPAAASNQTTLSAYNVMTDGSTNSAVTFSTDKAGSGLVNVNSTTGVCSAASTTTYGTANITATSQLKSAATAQSAVALKNYVVSNVAGVSGLQTLVSKDGTGTDAQFARPSGLTLDSTGYLYVTDWFTHMIRQVTPTGVVTTYAGWTAGTQDGALWAAALKGASPGEFSNPFAAAYDPSNNRIYVADNGSGRLRYLDDSVHTLPGSYPDPRGVAVDATGSIYIACNFGGPIYKLDSSGNVIWTVGTGNRGYIDAGPSRDDGSTRNSQAQFYSLKGIAVDSHGNVYAADSEYASVGNYRIRKVDSQLNVTTFAGNGTKGLVDGSASAAEFSDPSGLAVDVKGNVYVTEQGSGTVRRITPDGMVKTIVGTVGGTTYGYFADSPTSIQPRGIAVGADGTLYLADYGNNLVRKIVVLP